jgi:small subunit ribosomal protein S21
MLDSSFSTAAHRIGRKLSSSMEIKVFNNNVEKALKVAKKKLAGEGLFRELKRRRFYEKPSVRKKAKQREAQRRRQKWLAKRKME